jgi:hypothetical protein
MGIRTRLIAAAMAAAATLTAVGGVAIASAATSSPTESVTGDGTKPVTEDAVLAKVAASLQVSVEQLTTALGNMKQAVEKGADRAAAVGTFARELGISVAQAEAALNELSSGGGKPEPGKDEQPGVPEEAVKLLAAELHISVDQARQVFRDLKKVKARGEAIVKDPAFVAIAKGLGITPQQLLATLRKVKEEIGEKPKDKVPGGPAAK